MTNIEWTDETWNPTKGCSRVSPGCDNCYAMGQARRQDKPGKPYHGLTIYRESGARKGVDWSGRVRFVPEMLDAPLRWRKPRRVFVNSMSDLFHESLSNEQIAAVFGVMAACPRHTFQVLTKRSKRMREWFAWADDGGVPGSKLAHAIGDVLGADELACAVANFVTGFARWRSMPDDGNPLDGSVQRWPLPNVWLGVSVESAEQKGRLSELARTPAAVRFASLEPLLSDVGDLTPWLENRAWQCRKCERRFELGEESWRWIVPTTDEVLCPADDCDGELDAALGTALDWLIVGGESGHSARPCDLGWIESVVEQCRDAGVACFVKQLGARPVFRSPLQRFETFGPDGQAFALAPGAEMVVSGGLRHRKGADPSEWPRELRVREFPTHRSSSDG